MAAALAIAALAGCGGASPGEADATSEATATAEGAFASRPDETSAPSPAPDAATEQAASSTRPGRKRPRRAAAPGPAAESVVTEIVSGDTLRLRDGRVVRLAQIDAPDPLREDCYGLRARRVLQTITPRGTSIELESDPAIMPVDVEGRLVRYVRVKGELVNLRLVREGAASVWFPRGRRGRHAGELLAEARAARDARRGLWGACPATRLTPKQPVATARTRRR